jgi:hypothetical protein
MTFPPVASLPSAEPAGMSVRRRLAISGGAVALLLLFIAAVSVLPCL